MMLTLVRRTLTRAATLFVVIGTLLVLFQLTIVAMATTIAEGAGRNSGLTQPALPASCHTAITSASPTQPA